MAQYYPQLDGLRTIAVLAVIMHHWFSEIGSSFTRIGLEGGRGVTLFFVLSGFLITEILLNSREKIETHGIKKVLTTFYIRRTLRIFPIYYLYVFLILFFMPQYREYGVYFLTYTYNIYIWATGFNPNTPGGDWISPELSHTWTLCIEEQFYLFWPFVILFTPKKHLWYAIISTLAISFSFSYVNRIIFENATASNTISGMFGLTLGATLAMLKQDGKSLPGGKWALLCLMIAYAVFHFPIDSIKWLGRSFVMAEGRLPLLVSFYLVEGAYKGFNGWFGRFLSSKPMVVIGRVSYGIYLYHMVIPMLLNNWNNQFSMDLNEVTIMLLNFVFLTIVVTLSWFFIETPINNLKNKFKY